MNIAGEMEILKDVEALSARAAEVIADRMAGCTAPFRLALSGGSTPRGCYRRLAHASGALGLRGNFLRR